MAAERDDARNARIRVRSGNAFPQRSIGGDRLLDFPDIVTHCNINRIELYPVKE